MRSIKALIIFSMASFNLSVMPWCEGTDKFVPDTVFFQMHLEKRRFITKGGKAIRKLRAIIRLDTFNGIRKSFHTVFNKLGRRKGIMLLEGL